MLSLQQAFEAKASIIEYLKSTFSFKEKAVGRAFYQFITDEKEGMFKGPYISLKLPFVKAEAGEDIPLEIRPPFPPFDHQLKAFQRLTTSKEHQPQPTILTTGTDSGKTEAFLYPVLDYCYKNLHRKGIKVIILYPMNALATDQAGRLAEAIFDDPKIKGKITAGLFIGEGKANLKGGETYLKSMGKKNIIEDRQSILDSPPDILLTNFKMLDYALMRGNFHNLWEHNLPDNSILKFLVLDELHTYDGAQGSDVANLIRRLKLKLNLPEGQLCPVGTSATIGSGEGSMQLLADYASKVFGESFDETSIVTEKRVTTAEFFGKEKTELRNSIPTNYKLKSSLIGTEVDYHKYIKTQIDLWQINPESDMLQLGEELKEIKLVWDIVDLCSKDLLTVQELTRKLNVTNEEFSKVSEWDETYQFSPKEAVIASILALVTEAKTGSGKKYFPFLYLQIQMWIRELSGILRDFKSEPSFSWKDKINPEDFARALPPYFCRECGASGWLGVKHDNRTKFESDIKDVYQKYFSNHKNLFFINTDIEEHQPIGEYQATEAHRNYVNETNLEFHDSEKEGRVKVLAQKQMKGTKNVHICPECNTKNATSIIGTRISTLASITTSQVLSSDLDVHTDKDRKILAFTNGVQDAAHQAGFIQARNYRFTFRSALQKVINQLDQKSINLKNLQELFIEYWKKNADETGGNSIEAYLYKFFPSDLNGEIQLESYKTKGEFKPTFVTEFDLRVSWEIASEFGYTSILGRTLEKTGSSAVYFDLKKMDSVYDLLQPSLEKAGLTAINKPEFDKFLNAFLHRLRTRGGVAHEYLNKFRTNNLKLWDLNWNRDKRHYLNRRFGPKSRFPKLITFLVENRGLLDSTFTKQENWYHAYYKKSFQMAPTYVDGVNEFYTQLLSILSSESIGILDEKDANGMKNYCLNAEAIFINTSPVKYECPKCENNLTIAKEAGALLDGAKCMNYRCNSEYSISKNDQGQSYYQQVYNRGRSP